MVFSEERSNRDKIKDNIDIIRVARNCIRNAGVEIDLLIEKKNLKVERSRPAQVTFFF